MTIWHFQVRDDAPLKHLKQFLITAINPLTLYSHLITLSLSFFFQIFNEIDYLFLIGNYKQPKK